MNFINNKKIKNDLIIYYKLYIINYTLLIVVI